MICFLNTIKHYFFCNSLDNVILRKLFIDLFLLLSISDFHSFCRPRPHFLFFLLFHFSPLYLTFFPHIFSLSFYDFSGVSVGIFVYFIPACFYNINNFIISLKVIWEGPENLPQNYSWRWVPGLWRSSGGLWFRIPRSPTYKSMHQNWEKVLKISKAPTPFSCKSSCWCPAPPSWSLPS